MSPASRLWSTRCDLGARSSSLRRERGQALVELALALPVLLAIVGAIIDGGWAFHQAGLVSAAAEAAQRAVAGQDAGAGHCAGAPPAAYLDVARSAARASAPGLDPARLAVALQYLEPACTGRMRTLAVSVTYPVTALTPWFAPLLSGVRLAAQSATAVEEMPPPWWGQAGAVQAQQAQIISLTTAYGQATAALEAQQGQVASLTAAYGQAAAALEAQQGQVASLTAAYGQATAELQAQQAQIASLTTAYQTEAAQAASLSGTASYYYSQWQNAGATVSALSQAAGYYYGQWQSALQWAAAVQSQGQVHEGGPE